MDAKRKINVIVNGNPYLVEIADLSASPLQVIVNGRPYQVGIEMAEEEALAEIPTSTEVSTTTSVVAQPAMAVGDAHTIIAPMPGNIIEIHVTAGDRVSKDQVLCTLEAMKMQNAIRSTGDGMIKQVAVSPGQAVGYGDVLFTLE